MAAPKKTSTKSKEDEVARIRTNYGTPRGFWLYLALGALTLFGVYIVIARLGSLGYLSTSGLLAWAIDPGILSLLVILFGPLFIYRSVKGQGTPLLARIAAYTLVFIVMLAFLVAILSGHCDSIATNCSTDFWFRLSALYYANLYVPVFLSILMLVGNVALWLDRNGRSAAH